MAAPAFGSPAVKNYCSGSPFSSKFVLLHSNCHWKPELSTCFFGKESLRTFYVGLKTSNFCGSRYRRLSPTASLGGLLGGIFKGSDTGDATRQQYAGTVNTINGLEAEMSGLSDSELRDRTSVLKERSRLGESLDSILPQHLRTLKIFSHDHPHELLILSNIDRLWKEHLQAIKFVQQAVGLRGYAQRDPLIEYKLEGYNLFLEMMAR